MRRTLVVRGMVGFCRVSLLGWLGALPAGGQVGTYERSFGQSESAITKALQQMQGEMAGHLPTLDGFALAGEHGLERYQRAYFQATAQVSAAAEAVLSGSAQK